MEVTTKWIAGKFNKIISKFYLACNTYFHIHDVVSFVIVLRFKRSYTQYTKIYIYIYLCWLSYNMRNLYHIHVVLTVKKQPFKFVYDLCVITLTLSFTFQAEVKLEDLLNLSILISKGKEINWDCLSNGEWTGKSSLLKRVGLTFDMHCSIWGDSCMVPVRVSSFDQGFNHRRC